MYTLHSCSLLTPPVPVTPFGMTTRPPYTITSTILARAEEIGEAIGRAEAAAMGQDLRLRRINRVRTPQVERLLSVLQGTMSRRQIQQALRLRDRKSLRERYLLPALQDGYVEMTRPDAPSAKNQRYRLTELGRRACLRSVT